ncbi:MAG TPA: hypothetical protein VK400_03455 [Pyrinomonadaceae bacterium]|nr:hypothetical protein [Pyrinomonadaceae bacterium]
MTGSAGVRDSAGSVFRSETGTGFMSKRISGRRTNQSRESFTILERIGRAERGAVEDCVHAYGNLVWALAKKFAKSSTEAEKATVDIFNDIWARAAFHDLAECSEEKYILQIAIRRLIKPSTRVN